MLNPSLANRTDYVVVFASNLHRVKHLGKLLHPFRNIIHYSDSTGQFWLISLSECFILSLSILFPVSWNYKEKPNWNKINQIILSKNLKLHIDSSEIFVKAVSDLSFCLHNQVAQCRCPTSTVEETDASVSRCSLLCRPPTETEGFGSQCACGALHGKIGPWCSTLG